MFKKGILSVLVGFVVAAPTASATFLPPNNLHLEDNLYSFDGLTEAEFNEVIDHVETVYKDIVKELGGKLKVNRKWNDSTVNASASRMFNTWNVNMYGGLARRAEVTKDGFAMVVCHELGHHVAGFPFSSDWAANEGQSDYFATHWCSRMLWKADTAENAKARELITDAPQKMCDEVYRTEDEQNLCYRTAIAGKSLADLLAHLGGEEVDYETPDDSVVRRTDNNHPAAQCRLDTYLAGSRCVAQWDNALIPEDESKTAEHTCHGSKGHTVGLRPLCWFKPGLN